jgi:ribonucleoside-diphosphate reductase alpha chain
MLETLDKNKMSFTVNALEVLRKSYLKKDKNGTLKETPEEMFQRVAANVAQADALYGATQKQIDGTAKKFFSLISSRRFFPNSPTLMNAGRKLQQLSACFVLPVGDSMVEIFESVKHTAIIHQSGGGTGFSFSKIRPKNDRVSSTGGRASGPVSFMEVFDSATNTIKQGGTRRGANMGILGVDHPDILEFITCKHEEQRLTNFNISVAITDTFMEALKKGSTYDLINPRTKKKVREIAAKEVFDKIVGSAWKNGEPGIIFIDRINKGNPTPLGGAIEATNPCGEQPLQPYESCNLGSINLALMIDENSASVDWDRLEETSKTAVHFLDNVIDMNRYPLSEIERVTKLNRKIGLGVMGWADMLLKLRIKYSSDKAIELAGQVMRFIREKAYEASSELAEKRGAFPNWKGSSHNGTKGKRVRNATVTTIAPTGSISIIAGCSSGIEPVFAWQQKSRQIDSEFYWEHPVWSEYKNEEVLPDYFVKADQISPKWHVKMQAAFQQHVDNAVSKTVNLPDSATEKDVANTYLLAYDLGCKGITVYRDGSRSEQVFQSKEKVKKKDGDPLPEIIDEKRVVVQTREGKYYIHMSHINSEPKEVFVNVPTIGKSRPWVECISRLMSTAIRHGVPCEKLVDQLYKSHLQYGDVTSPLLAINKGIVKILEALDKKPNYELPCPDCGTVLCMEEGCMKCYSCGFSKC